MPFLEILAPSLSQIARATLAEAVTAGVCTAFAVAPDTVTIYFLDIPPERYAHAGRTDATEQRIFVKLHAYRREAAARRHAAASLTAAIAHGYDVPADAVALYFIDRAQDEVAHGGVLSSDAGQD
jgi:phenylpyruvate tautomerase PptA (4-oxalocrotonate tautomerase family)